MGVEIPPTIFPRVVTYEWSRDLSEASAKRYFSRRFRNAWSLAILLVGICAVCIGGLIFDKRQDMAIEYWVPIIIALMAVLSLGWLYFKVTSRWVELPDNRITVSFESEGVTFKTSETVSTMKWSTIKRLWKFPDVWLVFWFKGSDRFSPLPVEHLGPDLTKAIEDKVREHGGQIT
jgi:hypothetical protein